MAAEEAFDEVEAINGYFDQDIYDKYHDTCFTEEQLNKWMIFDHTTPLPSPFFSFLLSVGFLKEGGKGESVDYSRFSKT